MKKLLLLIAFAFLYLRNDGQDLLIQGASPNLYLIHTVAPKENYYSVGRLYNVPPKTLGTYNGLQFEKGLSLGQTIKIPLTEGNFSDGSNLSADEAAVPVYHVVQPKEGLYRVSANYNKVPLATLKKWNHLSSDVVSNGTKLIVGYLKVLKDQSALANNAQIPVADVPKKEEKKEVKTEKAPQKEVVLKEKEKVKEPIKDEPKEKPKPKEEPVTFPKGNDHSGGYFKKLYNKQSESGQEIKESGNAGTFKSTSGWQDGKYYCFHNEALPGTILKITNNATNKTVYAKVLDAIPDIKQNTGLLIRLSNAAADELQVSDSKFDCSISYTK